MDFLTIFSSVSVASIVVAIVTGLVAIRISDRKIAITNITQQRRLWRKKIRDIAKQVNSSYELNDKKTLRALYVKIRLLLNPFDNDDNEILETLYKMISSSDEDDSGDEDNLSTIFSEKLSLLLKHDWDRAKKEAKPICCIFFTNFSKKLAFLLKCDCECAKKEAKPIRCIFSTPKRISYDEFKKIKCARKK